MLIGERDNVEVTPVFLCMWVNRDIWQILCSVISPYPY